MALIVLVFLGLVVLMNRLDVGSEKEYLEIRECRDKQGYSVPCPLPPELTRDGTDGGPVGIRTICKDENGNDIRCP